MSCDLQVVLRERDFVERIPVYLKGVFFTYIEFLISRMDAHSNHKVNYHTTEKRLMKIFPGKQFACI